jgi:hypothetical protein
MCGIFGIRIRAGGLWVILWFVIVSIAILSSIVYSTQTAY